MGRLRPEHPTSQEGRGSCRGRGVIVVFAVIVVVDCCGGMPTFRSAGELDRRTRLAAWTSCWIGGGARRPMMLDPHSVIWASRVPVCILSP